MIAIVIVLQTTVWVTSVIGDCTVWVTSVIGDCTVWVTSVTGDCTVWVTSVTGDPTATFRISLMFLINQQFAQTDWWSIDYITSVFAATHRNVWQ